MKKVSILDYGVGNIKSISNSFKKIGVETLIVSKENQIINSDYLVLPGVGAFKNAMSLIESKNLIYPINQFIKKGNPFLGICLGMQLLFDSSNEFGKSKGLGLIKGEVNRLPESWRLPNIGWQKIHRPSEVKWEKTLLKDVKANDKLYFVHSYFVNPQNKNNVLSESKFNGYYYCSSVIQNNIFGVQFHPEKSASVGLRILENFIFNL